jgi:hypothetical protein
MRSSGVGVVKLAVIASFALGAAPTAGVVLARPVSGGTAVAASASVTVSKPLPSLVRIGDVVTITGHVHHAPGATRATLEYKRIGPWHALSSAKLRDGAAFTIRWRVRSRTGEGPLSLRIAAVRGGRTLAATAAAQSWVGSAKVYCAPATPPAVMIPVGDGWITGGLYGEGGAYPGMDACSSQPYTETAIDGSGKTVASQNVAARRSYTLVVPAGSYTLRGGGCSGMATVKAGRETKANTYCLYP